MEAQIDRVPWSGDVRKVLDIQQPWGIACCLPKPEEFYGGRWPWQRSMKKFWGEEKKKKVNIFLRAWLPALSPTGSDVLEHQHKSRTKCGHNKVFVAMIHLVLLSKRLLDGALWGHEANCRFLCPAWTLLEAGTELPSPACGTGTTQELHFSHPPALSFSRLFGCCSLRMQNCPPICMDIRTQRSWDSALLKATIAIHIINNHDLSVHRVSFSVNYNI